MTDGRITGGRSRAISSISAKQMLTEEMELFPGAEDTLTTLAASSPLMLITKGDLLHQRSKLERSGLLGCFRTSKSSVTRRLTSTRPSCPATVSPRSVSSWSAIRCVPTSCRWLKQGGWAVHIPAAVSWSHEDADARPRICTGASSRFRRSSACLTRSGTLLRTSPDRQLRLARVADALPQEPVEVEQRRRRQRVHVVRVVEGVEHLEARA